VGLVSSDLGRLASDCTVCAAHSVLGDASDEAQYGYHVFSHRSAAVDRSDNSYLLQDWRKARMALGKKEKNKIIMLLAVQRWFASRRQLVLLSIGDLV